MTNIEFNINSMVKVKLTETGIHHYRMHYSKFTKSLREPKTGVVPRSTPIPEPDA